MKQILGLLTILFFLPNFAFAISARELVAEINSERTARGFNALEEDFRLDKAGESKARALSDRGLLEHTKSIAGMPWSYVADTGYEYSIAGENLAVAVASDFNVVEDWLQSSAHRENVLNKNFTHIGLGVAEGAFGGASAEYVVAYFATPKESVNLQKSDISGDGNAQIEIMKSLIALLTQLINQLIASRA